MRLPKNVIVPLGVSTFEDNPALIYASKRRGHNKLSLAVSDDGLYFNESDEAPVILTSTGKSEDIDATDNFRFSQVIDENFLTYTKSGRLSIAKQKSDAEIWDMAIWKKLRTSNPRASGGMFVPEYKHNGQYVLFYNTSQIYVATTKDLDKWHNTHHPVVDRRRRSFDNNPLSIVDVSLSKKGILVLYSTYRTKNKRQILMIGAALFDKNNPTKLLWRSGAPVWQAKSPRNKTLTPIGAVSVEDENKLLIYLVDSAGRLRQVSMVHPGHVDEVAPPLHRYLKLTKSHKNPIIAPDDGEEWEQAGTFNPAAVVHDGKVHMFYRAMDPSGVSRFAYASSDDGVNFTRHREIAYNHEVDFTPPEPFPKAHDPNIYSSGGGWGGSEDPRAVIIDDHVHMSFCIFEHWQSMRQAIAKLHVDNLNERNWDWNRPLLVSPENQRQKNWMIFPERVNGKLAILHALVPSVAIEYFDTFEELEENPIHSPIQGDADRFGRPGWDGFLRGASAPPIKSEHGWVLFYHGTDPDDPNSGYRLGAMLLDLDDPTIILARTNQPILEPEEWYEHDRKPNVIYASAAVVKDGVLHIYYGGGDKHVCAASTDFEQFVTALKEEREYQFNEHHVEIE